MRINIFHHDSQTERELRSIKQSLLSLIKNQQKMGNQLDGIAADLQAANVKADKIAADVKNLDAQIAALSEAPTADEIAAVKAQSAALVDKLSGIDELTPDAEVPPVEGDGEPTEDDGQTPSDGEEVPLP